jgi:5'-nucleotidase
VVRARPHTHTGLLQAAGTTVGRLLSIRRRQPALATPGDSLVVTPDALDSDAVDTPERAARPARAVAIRILTLTDLHGALLTAGERDGRPLGGAAYLAAYLARERAARPRRTLFLHNGDAVGMTPPISGLLQDEPTVAVLNALGCAAGALGDHELDEGQDELFRLLDGGTHPATLLRSGSFLGSGFPWLAANVLSETTGHPILPAYRVFDLAGVRVGVIGVVTTETPRLVGGGARGLRFADEAATVNHYVAELRDGPERAQAIVVLAHLGGTTAQPGQTAGPIGGPMARFATKLEERVDVVIGGDLHAHSYVATVAGKLIVQGPPFGAALGLVDLTVDPDERRVIARSATLLPVWQDMIDPDPAITDLVSGVQRVSASLGAEPVAVSARPLRRQPGVAPTEPSLGDVVAGAFQQIAAADLAVVHPLEIRADLPAGQLTRVHVYAVLPGGHTLVTMRLSADQIRRLLEEQWTKARTSRLHVAGLVAEFAPEAPAGQRVRSISLAEGGPLERGRTYTVAMTDFLAGGGDGFRTPLAGMARTHGPLAVDALVTYLRKQAQPIASDLETSTATIPILQPVAPSAQARPAAF